MSCMADLQSKPASSEEAMNNVVEVNIIGNNLEQKAIKQQITSQKDMGSCASARTTGSPTISPGNSLNPIQNSEYTEVDANGTSDKVDSQQQKMSIGEQDNGKLNGRTCIGEGIPPKKPPRSPPPYQDFIPEVVPRTMTVTESTQTDPEMSPGNDKNKISVQSDFDKPYLKQDEEIIAINTDAVTLTNETTFTKKETFINAEDAVVNEGERCTKSSESLQNLPVDASNNQNNTESPVIRGTSPLIETRSPTKPIVIEMTPEVPIVDEYNDGGDKSTIVENRDKQQQETLKCMKQSPTEDKKQIDVVSKPDDDDDLSKEIIQKETNLDHTNIKLETIAYPTKPSDAAVKCPKLIDEANEESAATQSISSPTTTVEAEIAVIQQEENNECLSQDKVDELISSGEAISDDTDQSNCGLKDTDQSNCGLKLTEEKSSEQNDLKIEHKEIPESAASRTKIEPQSSHNDNRNDPPTGNTGDVNLQTTPSNDLETISPENDSRILSNETCPTDDKSGEITQRNSEKEIVTSCKDITPSEHVDSICVQKSKSIGDDEKCADSFPESTNLSKRKLKDAYQLFRNLKVEMDALRQQMGVVQGKMDIVNEAFISAIEDTN